MKLEYLETAEAGLRWMRQYYRQNPQLDRVKAVDSLRRAEQDLIDFPFSGPKFDDFDDVRSCKIQGTAFSLLYTVRDDIVWVIDVRDPRGLRSAEALRYYTGELRQRYGFE